MNVITVTLNPAFDIHCVCEDFAAQKENLVKTVSRDAGGKGVNTSRALAAGGKESRAVVAVGRGNGDDYLKQLSARAVDFTALTVDGRIRENITIHSSGDAETRISFAGFTADKSLLSDEFAGLVAESVHDSGIEIDFLCALLSAVDISAFGQSVTFGVNGVAMNATAAC